MLATTVFWLGATGVVAVAFENVGAALVLWGIAGPLIKLA
jgi:hypothetical protein